MMIMKQHERSGKWTKDEEEYAQALMNAFHKGHLMDIEEGTSLRKYLAKKLLCSAKRISKKFEGTDYKGKMLYMKAHDAPVDCLEETMASLDKLEDKFRKAAAAVEQEEQTRKNSVIASVPTQPSSIRTANSISATSTAGPLGFTPMNTSLLEALPRRGTSGAQAPSQFLGVTRNDQNGTSYLARQQFTASLLATGGLPSLFPTAAIGSARLEATREAELRSALVSRAGLSGHLAVTSSAASLPSHILDRGFQGGLNTGVSSLYPLNNSRMDALRLQRLEESIRNRAAPMAALSSANRLEDNIALSSRFYLERAARANELLEQEVVRRTIVSSSASLPPLDDSTLKRMRENEEAEQRAAKRGSYFRG